jgi:hypothetical protein
MTPTTEEIAQLLWDGTESALTRAANKAQEWLTQGLMDAIDGDKWGDANPAAELEALFLRLDEELYDEVMKLTGGVEGLTSSEAIQAMVDEFIDARLAPLEDTIVDDAADRLSDSFSFSRDAAAHFGHDEDDF